MSGSPLSWASGTCSCSRATSPSRSALTRAACSACRATASSTARANPAMAGVSIVPERMSRSWPPPCSCGVTSRSRRTTSAPTPYGPPTLCAVSVSASTPEAAKSTGTWPTACTASVCTGMPWACASATTSATGWTVPTSLLAHITETRATLAGRARGSRAARRRRGVRARRPAAARPRRPRARRASAAGRGPRGARRRRPGSGCGAGPAARRAQNRPLSARLSDSVPPEVNTTSPGRQPSARAIVSRDSSTTRRAARPGGVQRGRVAEPGELLGHRRDRLGVHRRRGGVVEVDGVFGHCTHQRTACRGSPRRQASSRGCHGWSGCSRRSDSRSQARRPSSSSGHTRSRSMRSLRRCCLALKSSDTSGRR